MARAGPLVAMDCEIQNGEGVSLARRIWIATENKSAALQVLFDGLAEMVQHAVEKLRLGSCESSRMQTGYQRGGLEGNLRDAMNDVARAHHVENQHFATIAGKIVVKLLCLLANKNA